MVEDDGKSLDSSKVEELFLPYTRNNQHVVGYGLGLAITKKIVTWHNGDIAVSHSNTLGGACFKLILPIAGATTST
jgi:signal transduction histidine kinase